jgi:hypothetical protein
LPLRTIANALGLPVEWNQNTQTVYLGHRTQEFYGLSDLIWFAGNRIRLGSSGLVVRGIEIPADPGGFSFTGAFDTSGNSDFNLNAEYVRFTASGVVTDGGSSDTVIGHTIRFYGDGNLLGEYMLRQYEPIDIDISLVGVHTLRIERPTYSIPSNHPAHVYNIRIFPAS